MGFFGGFDPPPSREGVVRGRHSPEDGKIHIGGNVCAMQSLAKRKRKEDLGGLAVEESDEQGTRGIAGKVLRRKQARRTGK